MAITIRCQKNMNKTEKQIAIERCAIFLADRFSYAAATGNTVNITPQAIEKMLKKEFANVGE